MKTVLFLLGTRPEVIKLAPLFRACREKASLRVRLCTSGQHGALLSEALAEWGMTADVSFTVLGALPQKTAECLTRLDAVLAKEPPDALLVHGDTLTAFCGALAAFYRGVPVFHVEAGLRTNSPFSPFPEEVYRRVIDILATLCFAPTARAAARLLAEGKPKERVFTVGNTVVDGLFATVTPDFAHPLYMEGKKTVLVTLHRRETQGAQLAEICRGIRDALCAREDAVALFPVHPSPAVGETVRAVLGGVSAVRLIPPLSRFDFCNLLARATAVLTDSGGVSEEATALGVPTLVAREETERPEGVEAGVLQVVGRTREGASRALSAMLDDPPPHAPSPVFGDGRASERIADVLAAWAEGKYTALP